MPLRILFYSWIERTLDAAQEAELMKLLADERYEEEVMLLLRESWEMMEEETFFSREEEQNILRNIFPQEKEANPSLLEIAGRKRERSRSTLAIAATIAALILTGAFLYFLNFQERKQPESSQPIASKVIVPGRDQAILTLEDGHQIVLDSAGDISTRNNGLIENRNGQLVYGDEQVPHSGAISFHTVTTPKGGQYQLVLADGTRVWLNAVSSIRFPIVFNGSERRVEVTGEAYFEVVKDVSRPFKVMVRSAIDSSEVEVLGTHFNVNAYSDEPGAATTLLEGAVKVKNSSEVKMLLPGQQAVLRNGRFAVYKDVNVAEVTSWRSGFFEFNETDIQTIMRQLARWYDIKVVFESSFTQRFNGSIPRSADVLQVLRMLEKTGVVHFSIEGRQVSVKSI